MATSKLNKEQYANIGSFAGIMLVYNSTNKDGELVQTAQHFFGADFEPADKSDNEIFRVIKNMVATMWHTIAEEKKLRADATAYARNSVPQPLRKSSSARSRETVSRSTTLPTAFGRVSVLCRPK